MKEGRPLKLTSQMVLRALHEFYIDYDREPSALELARKLKVGKSTLYRCKSGISEEEWKKQLKLDDSERASKERDIQDYRLVVCNLAEKHNLIVKVDDKGNCHWTDTNTIPEDRASKRLIQDLFFDLAQTKYENGKLKKALQIISDFKCDR